MDSVVLYSVFAIIASVFTVSMPQGDTCRACNCQFDNIQALNQLIKEEIAAAAISGVTYTRWGRTSCPNDNKAQLVYSGRAGGTNWNAQGGSAEKVCLPDDPDYIPGSIDISSSPFQTIRSVVQGVEFRVHYGLPGNPLEHLHDHNAPCAVCFVPTRSTTITIPAKTVCPLSWTREYYGYLMTEHDGFHRSVYTCLDVDSESVAGEGNSTSPSLLFHAVTDCNGLLCPPYENNRLLSCVVCTK